jgi:DNA-binding IclR family transcriptional regulator
MDSATSVEKALDILLHLHGTGALGVTGIARGVELPKSTTHRLLASLARRRLVEQDENGRYRTGLRLVALGLGVLDREPVVAAARPLLEAEARASGESVFLAAARGGRIVVLDKVDGTGFLRAAPRVGEEVPIVGTATGRLHVALAPQCVEEPAAPNAARRALAQELARVRRSGWARSRNEWIPGLAVVAAPVWVGGRLLAAVALAAPAVRLLATHEERVARRLQKAAEQIRAALEGRAS